MKHCNRGRNLTALAVMGATLVSAAPAVAQEEAGAPVFEIELPEEQQTQGTGRRATRLPQIDVIGRSEEQVRAVPGSATVITEEDLEQTAAVSANEVLRTVPGVHVVEEEGIGLRPNIGMRGLNPIRSSNVLILEDGVPIALAPYGEPELYYAPSVERMQRLEVVKGSGSILFGPQTVGGVVNYITADPPEEFTVTGELRAGNFGYYMGRASVGDTVGAFGYHFDVMHQRFEGHRGLNLQLTDVSTKLRYRLSDAQDIGLKLHFYDEFSNATYLGLTTPQFENVPEGNFAVNDELPVRRYAAAATHNLAIGDNALLQTTIYGSNTSRNWNRQDYDRTDGGRDYDRVIDGEGRDITRTATRPDDRSAIYFRDTMGSRNRAFTIGGVEPRLTVDYRLGNIDNELIVGTRFHYEYTSEQRVDTPVADPDNRTIREDEDRTGMAVAAYALNRFMFLDQRLRVSPGVRVESFWYGREILRTRVDGVPADLDPTVKEEDHILAVIPGLGVSYDVVEQLTLFAGAHRGFAPPRTKDSITSDGQTLELEPEFSINYELGLRTSLADYLGAEVTGFLLDFSQQIIPPSEAGGAVSANPDLAGRALVNAGETTHYGVESSVTFDVATLTHLGFRLPLTVTYTWVHAEFGEGWEEDIAGNRLPYAPEHRLSTQLRFVHPTGISAQVAGHYVSEQFTDKLETVEPSVDGTRGQIDGRFLLDARLAYTFAPLGLTAYVAGKNLTDERYIAARAPSGINPGMFRQVFGGIQGTF
jgi:Fe(3+) dicitrate transport protein